MVGESRAVTLTVCRELFPFLMALHWLLCSPPIYQCYSSVLAGLLTGVGDFPGCRGFFFFFFFFFFPSPSQGHRSWPALLLSLSLFFFFLLSYPLSWRFSFSLGVLGYFVSIQQVLWTNSSTNWWIFHEFMGGRKPHVLPPLPSFSLLPFYDSQHSETFLKSQS